MKNKFSYIIRGLFRIIYWFLIIAPVVFLVMSIPAYYHVKNAIGEEPGSEEIVWPLVHEKHVTLHLPPHEVGVAIILAFFVSLVSFIFIIVINAAVAGFWKPFPFYKRLALLAAIINVVVFLALRYFQPAGWYLTFILD